MRKTVITGTVAAVVAVAALSLSGCGSSPGPAAAHPTATSSAHPNTATRQTFSDGTILTLVSAEQVLVQASGSGSDPWTPAAKFDFHIVAGSDWRHDSTDRPAKYLLRPYSGDERSGGHYSAYYMVTSTGWEYPGYNGTGYADPTNGYASAPSDLAAGESADVSSVLVTQMNWNQPETVTVQVSILMPNGQIESKVFTTNVTVPEVPGHYSPPQQG